MIILLSIIIGALVFVATQSYSNRMARMREYALNPPAGRDAEAVVWRILATGDKIGAIRLYREMTGKSLKESKDAVEAMNDSKNNG